MTNDRRSTTREGEITDAQVRGAAMRVVRENLDINEAQFTEGDVMRDKVRELLASTSGINLIKDKPAKLELSNEEKKQRELSPEETTEFLGTLEKRLVSEPKGYKRPEGIKFAEVKAALTARPDLMWSLFQAENTGSIVDIRKVEGNKFIFCDFAKQTAESRRSLRYSEVKEEAKKMGVDIQSEQAWRELLELGDFETGPSILSVWLDSDDISYMGVVRLAGIADGRIKITAVPIDTREHELYGWRFELRVPKVA